MAKNISAAARPSTVAADPAPDMRSPGARALDETNAWLMARVPDRVPLGFTFLHAGASWGATAAEELGARLRIKYAGRDWHDFHRLDEAAKRLPRLIISYEQDHRHLADTRAAIDAEVNRLDNPPKPPAPPPMWTELAGGFGVTLSEVRAEAEPVLRSELERRHYGDRRSIVPWRNFMKLVLRGEPTPEACRLRHVLVGHGLPPAPAGSVFGDAPRLSPAPRFTAHDTEAAAFSPSPAYLAAVDAFGERIAVADPARVAKLTEKNRSVGFADALRKGTIRDNRDIVRLQDRRELARLFEADMNDGRAHLKLNDVDVSSSLANDAAVEIARRQLAAWEGAAQRATSAASNEAHERQRERLVAIVDSMIARAGTSLVGWWARELRRHLAPEGDEPTTEEGRVDTSSGGWVHPLAARTLTELGVDLVELAASGAGA